MIVGYLNLVRISILPNETDPVAVVDPDAVLSGAVAFQGLKRVSRGAEIPQALRSVKLEELAHCNLRDRLHLPGSDSVEDVFGVAIAEGADHTSIVYR